MPKGYKQVSTLSPEQQNLFQQVMGSFLPFYQSGQSYLQNLLSGSPEAFSAFEAPYKRQFEQETVPMLAERFSGLGSGAQSSSAFQQALGQAGAGLSENLASLRSQLQFGAAQQPMDLLSQLLGLQTKAYLQKPQKQPGFGKQLATSLMSGIGQGIGNIPLMFSL